ncbi:anti-sigma factor [Agrococcus sp. TF02-05]|uniref:anti-sigma factor n=1 Tax=Agrococcus sp. TF02-05 TaxID=2815211 RepID=UPI001AA13FDD|nr:anti-sigma factor [Agrococcus sp. TF02-05]MBO1769426.1 anti-sigma factor [Agrococcus sp. TF02-05]
MQHLPEESLVALALGEAVEGGEHAAGCATCSAEVAAFRAAAQRVRAADVVPAAPPAGVWDRIAAELDEPSATGAAPSSASDASAASLEAPASTGAPVTSIDVARRRRRRFGVGALAAASLASAAVAASIAVLVVTQLGSDPRSTNVAQATLDPLATTVGAARAEVVERDGQRLLVVDVDELPEVEGYLDVWLLDPDAQQMVSLGVMDASTTQLALPGGLDLDAFPIVDVSVEPFDGDPTHSGDSLWRGALES